MAFRVGQWVKLKQDMRLDNGDLEPKGTVGVFNGQAMQTTPEGRTVPVIGFGEVHLVSFPEGETRVRIGIPFTHLEPVLTKTEIPEARLVNTPPEWEPLP